MKLSRLLVALLVMTFLAGTCLGQQPADQPPVAGEENDEKKGSELREQTIYIPFDKLHHVFEKPDRGVFLPYEKFQELWRQARQSQDRAPAVRIPLRSLITSIDSQATVKGDVVRVVATLSIEVLGKGWHEVPLRLQQSAILSARIGEDPARIIYRQGQGHFLLIEQPEDGDNGYQLVMEYARAFARAPGQNQVAFQAPQSSVNRWTIRIPEPGVEVHVHPLIAATEIRPLPGPVQVGNNDPAGDGGDDGDDGDDSGGEGEENGEDAEPEDGAADKGDPGETRAVAAFQDPVPPTMDETVLLAFFGVTPTVKIDWTPKSEGAAGLTALATVQASQTVTIDEGAIRTRADLAYEISRAELTQIQLLVPADQKVAGVFDPNIRQWDVAEQDGRQLITVQLFEPAKTNQKITIELEKFDIDMAAEAVESIPAIEALGVARQQGTLLIRLDGALRGDVVTRRGLLQIDIAELSGGAANSRWDFAYRYAALPFDLELKIEKVEPRVTTTELVEVYLEPEQLTVDLFVKYQVERAGIFQLQLVVPTDYEIRHIRGHQASGAAPVVVDNYHRAEDDPTQLTVYLSRRAFGEVGLLVELQRTLDDENLLTPTGTATDYTIAFPRVDPSSVARTNGRLILYAPESLRITPLEIQGGRALSFTEALDGIESVRGSRFATTRPVHAFAFSADLFTPQMSALRRQPQVTAGQLLAVDVQPGVVKYEAIFHYVILYSSIRSLRIDLPEGIVADVRNRTTLFQESVMDPAPEDLAEGYVAWNLQADRELLGGIDLRLSWEQTIELPEGKSEQWSIPHLQPRDVQRAWGQIVFSKGENIDVNKAGAMDGLRAIDPRIDLMIGTPAELVLNSARAFEFHQDWTLEVSATRYQPEELETTVVEQAVFRMVVTLSGQQSVQALYRLRSAEQRLRMKFPGQAQIIELKINGASVTPEQGEGDEYLIPLKSIAADQEFVLEVVYKDPDPDNSYLEIPVFTDNPAIHEAHLCAFLPRRKALLNYGGPWTDSFSVGPSEIFSGNIHSQLNNEDLVRQLASGLVAPEELSFELQGQEYIFSTLQPDMSEEGGLSLTTMSRNWLHGLLYLVVGIIGVLGLRVKIKEQVLLAAGLVTFSVLLGVFLPVLYLQLMDGYFVISTMLVFGVWAAWDGVQGLQAISTLLPLRRKSTAAVEETPADEIDQGDGEGVDAADEAEPEEVDEAESEEDDEAEPDKDDEAESDKEEGSDEDA